MAALQERVGVARKGQVIRREGFPYPQQLICSSHNYEQLHVTYTREDQLEEQPETIAPISDQASTIPF